MNKLTLDDLRRKYADRAVEPIEKPMSLAVQSPVVEPTETIQAVAPVSKVSARTSSGPIAAFMIFSGLFMFVGLTFLVTGGFDSSSSLNTKSSVLGESTVSGETAISGKDLNNYLSSVVSKIKTAVSSTDHLDVYYGEDTETESTVSEEESNMESSRDEFIINVIDDMSSEDLSEESSVTNETTVTESETEVVEEESDTVKVLPVTGNYVTLRKSPNGDAYTRAASGTTFGVVSETEVDGTSWIEVKYDESTTYWIRGDLVEKL